jgi:hypothetical protein
MYFLIDHEFDFENEFKNTTKKHGHHLMLLMDEVAGGKTL